MDPGNSRSILSDLLERYNREVLENPGWWPDFHHQFITYAAEALYPTLRPRCRVRIGERFYLVCVSRMPVRYRFEVYPCTIRVRLPRIRVPLRAPDPDIVLDLQAVFTRCYDSGGYGDFVDYRSDPPVPLSPADAEWADGLLHAVGCRTVS